MLLNSNGSAALYHVIEADHLITLLKTTSFSLGRLDLQNDPKDGKLPEACFEEPRIGPVEKSLNLDPVFLKSQARAIDACRASTFIMSWTFDLEHLRKKHPDRCILVSSEMGLKRLIGYQWLQGAEFPPPPRKIGPHDFNAEIKRPQYTPGKESISVIPSYYATAHKEEGWKEEEEVRVEAFESWDNFNSENLIADERIPWEITQYSQLEIILNDQISDAQKKEISELAAKLGIKT